MKLAFAQIVAARKPLDRNCAMLNCFAHMSPSALDRTSVLREQHAWIAVLAQMNVETFETGSIDQVSHMMKRQALVIAQSHSQRPSKTIRTIIKCNSKRSTRIGLLFDENGII